MQANRNMSQPSPDVQTLIAAKSAVQPGSASPAEFMGLQAHARRVTTDINAELTRRDSDFQRVVESAAVLVELVERLRVIDADLRRQTPNGKRPRPYEVPEVDHHPDIERHLVGALSCLQFGDRPATLNQLANHTADAYFLVRDAVSESLRLRGE